MSEGNEMTKFDRADSEDDILEEYGDECNCSSRLHFVKSRTAIEKYLFVFSLICLIIIIVLAACLGSKTPPPGKSLCESQDCIEVSSSVLTSMDQTADPCADFYQYSCGGWVRNNPAPPGYLLWDRVQQLSYTNMYKVKYILDNREMVTPSEQKTKKFYGSCMAESVRTRLKTLHDFWSLITNISSASENRTLGYLLESVHSLNAWPLFSISVGTDDRKPDSNIIKIHIGDHHYPLSVNQVHSPSTTPAPTPTINSTSGSGGSAGYRVINSKSPEYLKWNSTEVEKNFLEEKVRILKVIWNMTESEATNTSKALLEIEKVFTKTFAEHTSINTNHTPAYMAVDELQRKCSMIDWAIYLDVMLKETSVISNSEQVVVIHKEVLLRTCQLVDSYWEDSSKRSLLELYIQVHLVTHLMPYFEADTFEPNLDPAIELEIDGEQWRRCVHYTNKALGFVTGALYVNSMGKHSSIAKIKQIVQDVKLAFKDYLLRKFWMDSSTKKQAAIKLDEILEKISYPEYILESDFLDKYYDMLETGDDWFVNVQRWQEFMVKHMMSQLRVKPDRSSWINPPVTVESDYSPIRNDVIFPIALFHLPFYTEEGPPAFNFGAIGSVIGHEITHAFDIKGDIMTGATCGAGDAHSSGTPDLAFGFCEGRLYDGKGRRRQWWDPITASRFEQTTPCMKEQYDSYTYEGFQVNGNITLDENIADNGGLRSAFIAYQLWERQNGKDPAVPGLDLTNRQLFFVSYAQMYCSKWKKKGLISHIIDDTHSPGPIRVLGSISNNQAFAEEFQCPMVANYNPRKKCYVW